MKRRESLAVAHEIDRKNFILKYDTEKLRISFSKRLEKEINSNKGIKPQDKTRIRNYYSYILMSMFLKYFKFPASRKTVLESKKTTLYTKIEKEPYVIKMNSKGLSIRRMIYDDHQDNNKLETLNNKLIFADQKIKEMSALLFKLISNIIGREEAKYLSSDIINVILDYKVITQNEDEDFLSYKPTA